jgi:hypothetical protein
MSAGFWKKHRWHVWFTGWINPLYCFFVFREWMILVMNGTTLFPKEIMSCFNSEAVAMHKHMIELA